MLRNPSQWEKRLLVRRHSWPYDLREEWVYVATNSTSRPGSTKFDPYYDEDETSPPSRISTDSLKDPVPIDSKPEPPLSGGLEFNVDLHEFGFALDFNPITVDLALFKSFIKPNDAPDAESPRGRKGDKDRDRLTPPEKRAVSSSSSCSVSPRLDSETFQEQAKRDASPRGRPTKRIVEISADGAPRAGSSPKRNHPGISAVSLTPPRLPDVPPIQAAVTSSDSIVVPEIQKVVPPVATSRLASSDGASRERKASRGERYKNLHVPSDRHERESSISPRGEPPQQVQIDASVAEMDNFLNTTGTNTPPPKFDLSSIGTTASPRDYLCVEFTAATLTNPIGIHVDTSGSSQSRDSFPDRRGPSPRGGGETTVGSPTPPRKDSIPRARSPSRKGVIISDPMIKRELEKSKSPRLTESGDRQPIIFHRHHTIDASADDFVLLSTTTSKREESPGSRDHSRLQRTKSSPPKPNEDILPPSSPPTKPNSQREKSSPPAQARGKESPSSLEDSREGREEKGTRELMSSEISVAIKHVLRSPLGEITQHFLYAFLWNFDMFLTSERLLYIVILFYRLDSTILSISFLAEWIKLRSGSLRLHSEWIELFQQFLVYLESSTNEEQVSHSRLLKKSWDLIEKKQLQIEKINETLIQHSRTTPLPYPVVEFSPVDIASQLTFMIHHKLRTTPVNDWRCWTRRHKPAYKAHDFHAIHDIIAWFNQISCWTASSILLIDGTKQRTTTMVHWIKIMLALLDWSNFECLMSVYLAFELQPIRSLKEEWKLVPKPLLIQLKTIENLCTPNRNYQNFRQHLLGVNKLKPFVPIIAVLLKDLTVFEENQTLFNNSVINWSKLSSLGQLFETIRLSTVSFNQLPFLPEIQKLIDNGIQQSVTIDELYSLTSATRTKSPYGQKQPNQGNKSNQTSPKKKHLPTSFSFSKGKLQF